MKIIKSHNWSDPKIITIDIETRLINNVHIPYLFSMYDGVNIQSFFSNNPESLFNELLRRKYEGYQVYAHNLARFDVIFLFKYLGSLHKKYNIFVLKRKDLILSITITNKKDHVNLTIKDSYLLLPSSLAKLSKNFNIETPKTIEPVLIEDISNNPDSLNYIQSDISHYTKEVIKMNNFNEWIVAIQKYCEIDCISLYQIIIKFRSLIFDNFNILIDKYPTTPSLAFAIFRCKYMKKDTIPILNGNVDKFIRGSFTGGSTDAIIPHGVLVHVYDFNSLYPSQMLNNFFPIGQINTFSDLSEVPKDNLWFAEVEISTKKDLFIPYLQIHHNNRTISPNGSFKMIISSIEYFNSLNDYNIKIIKGYHFEGGNLFFDYVNDMYQLRMKYSKTHPMNFIAKLLMNSLYGRFGMKDVQTISIFVNKKVLNELNHNLLSSIKLDEDLFFIESTVEDTKNFEVNVGISSLITSYSRVRLQLLKQYCIDNGIIIYYFDTDSILHLNLYLNG